MGRILGIDFGTKRVGAAVSDPRHLIATPLEVYERRDLTQDAKHYRLLMEENEVERIVIGLPVHLSGREGTSASLARTWGDWLQAATGVPVVFSDERFTSVDAEEALISVGMRRSKRKGFRDMLAAQIVLQHYLDDGYPDTEARAQPLDDVEGP